MHIANVDAIPMFQYLHFSGIKNHPHFGHRARNCHAVQEESLLSDLSLVIKDLEEARDTVHQKHGLVLPDLFHPRCHAPVRLKPTPRDSRTYQFC